MHFKIFSNVILTSLFFLIFMDVGHAEQDNQKHATELFSSLDKKVMSSILASRKKGILPADFSRLTIQCLDDEFQFRNIQNDLIIPWQESWRSKNIQSFNRLVNANFNSQMFSKYSSKKTTKLDNITLETFQANPKTVTLKNALADYSIFIGNFKNYMIPR